MRVSTITWGNNDKTSLFAKKSGGPISRCRSSYNQYPTSNWRECARSHATGDPGALDVIGGDPERCRSVREPEAAGAQDEV